MGFKIFGAFIPYYGFFIVVGIVCASILAFFLSKFTSLNFDNCILIGAYFIAFGFFGAKLLFLFVTKDFINWKFLFSDLNYINTIFTSGFVFYGGLLGGICALPVLKKIHKIPLEPYLQILTPCVALVHAFGRIGCSFAGCCYGKPTNGTLYFIYRNNPIAPNNIKLVPIQGIEAFFLFIFVAIFTILILNKSKIQIPMLYIFSYSILRFIIEFFRGDLNRGFIGYFSTSQIISVVLIFCVFVYKIFVFYSAKNRIVSS